MRGNNMIDNYVIVDLETTGLNPADDKIIEIGAIKIRADREPEVYNVFVNPGIPIGRKIQEITGITDDMVRDAAAIEEIIGDFAAFTEDLPLLGHNLRFDYGFLKTAAAANRIKFDKQGVDTLTIARKYLPDLKSRRLDILCEYFGIEDEQHHRAWNDAKVTGELYHILWEKFGQEPQAEKDFSPKTMMFTVKKTSPITAKQAGFLKALLIQHGITPDYEIGELTKSEASKKIDAIISQFGRY
jgi:DNA polymerase-3 subunit alpha (Gram-positive type)